MQATIVEQRQGIRVLLVLSRTVQAAQHDLVLRALACLTAQWPCLMRAAFAEDGSMKRKIEEQLRSPSPEARYVACRCLVNYCKSQGPDSPEQNVRPPAQQPTLQSSL